MTDHAGTRAVLEKSALGLVRTFDQDRPNQIDGSTPGVVEYELRRADWAMRDSGDM
jgi:hypothetical protein